MAAHTLYFCIAGTKALAHRAKLGTHTLNNTAYGRIVCGSNGHHRFHVFLSQKCRKINANKPKGIMVSAAAVWQTH